MKIDIFTKAMGCTKLTYQNFSFLEVIHPKKRVSAEKKRLKDYVGNYIYENDQLQFFNHAEGYTTPDGSGGFDYVYQYLDHLGNIRISYSDNVLKNGIIEQNEIIEENNYYPFGLKHEGYNNVVLSEHDWKFQGQELTEDLGLNMYEFKYRMHDPAIGRFMQIDPLAEDYLHNGTYNFSENRVIDAFELEGLEAVLIIDKDKRPNDNGTPGTTYTGEMYYLNETTGDVNGPYAASTYPNSKSNSDNSTKSNTVNEGDHNYNNESGHKGGTKKGLNIDDKGDRKTDGNKPNGDDVTMQYVNVHEGASDKGNFNSRGSAGCITCSPNDSEAFFENFNWTNSSETKGDSKGTITVKRGSKSDNKFDLSMFKMRGLQIKRKNAVKESKKNKPTSTLR